MDLYGRDFICTQDWKVEELMAALELAAQMKRDRFSDRWTSILKYKTFLMFFYNPSVRTRISFEAAATELGGHSQFMTPSAGRFKTQTKAGETIEDAAQVMARYVAGIGIRILEDKVPYYGAGDEMLLEYAKWSNAPIINMADDRFHPCQALADVMGWAEWYGEGPGRPDFEALRGKKFLLSWGSGALARSWCSVQAALLIASRLGMQVTMAHPEGYDLDPEVIQWTKQNCAANQTDFEVVHDPDSGYDGAHIVYSRNWVSAAAYQDGALQKQAEIEKAMAYTGWTANGERMSKTDNAIFTHPMPVDRGSEVTDEVASGPRSAVYDIAENRLHVQKAVMALTMGL
ncbi:MAG: ornithine carbamoyltransferase [Chloroflexi bacterium]|nr:MAG: ornithine carbamoyltransferase [Chloroflexota bacterium]RLC79861.1 MAG: ornithine carbamoyltransferase [Chloroflexota bacterium]HEY74528.1 ornithine carbamoyltransferase [Thermoflexia bacterium]